MKKDGLGCIGIERRWAEEGYVKGYLYDRFHPVKKRSTISTPLV
ncbi:MAG: hypothetical protein R2764_20805 [Bacteroidales bacterium]